MKFIQECFRKLLKIHVPHNTIPNELSRGYTLPEDHEISKKRRHSSQSSIHQNDERMTKHKS
jgi:hypothetical protein